MRSIWVVVLAVLVLGLLAFLVTRGTSQTVGLTVVWTAPGDDGNVGRAMQYDLRYSPAPIAGTDTLTWWNSATQALGEPSPSLSGAPDSMKVLGLQPSTTYRFIIKSADEVPNWSGYSNIAVATTADLVPPARITDLLAR